MTTDRLTDAIEQAYQRFATYSITAPLIYCDCPVCMTPQIAAMLLNTPLKQIQPNILAEYTNSAHGYDPDIIEPQFKYFLPRYLELIANDDPPTHQDLECCLIRLDGYRDNWPMDEIATIDEFFNAYLEASLKQINLVKWPIGLRLKFNIGEVLTMIILAGGDLDQCLKTIENAKDPETAIHMANLRSSLITKNSDSLYYSVYLDIDKKAAKKIASWLIQPKFTQRILNATDLLNDPKYDDILEMGLVEYNVPPKSD